MPRPPVQKTKRLAEAAEIGRLQAIEKMRKRHSKLTLDKLQVSAFEHLGKLIDRVTPSEIMELTATIGTTLVLASSLEFLGNLAGAIRQSGEVIYRTLSNEWFINPIQTLLEEATKRTPLPEQESIKKGSLPNLTITEWLVCFSVAYVLVHNIGMIINAGGNIVKAGIDLVSTAKLAGVVAGA